MSSKLGAGSPVGSFRGLQSILSRDRLIAGLGSAALVALAWTYVVRTSGGIGGDGMAITDAMAMPQARGADIADFGTTFAMWAVMMVAMMVPSAAPVILLHASARAHSKQASALPTIAFVGGYVVVWGGFAAGAAVAHMGFQSASLLSSELRFANALVGATVLIGAGLYQWTNLKTTCVTTCRSPLGFLMSEWRDGPTGALVMGIRHGIFCLGCCWVLMALLFVGGVMNLVWIAGIAAFVLVEKLVSGRRGIWLSRVSGVVLASWGVLTLTQAVLA
ncbi:MAG: DUF2182 domain-containing protein [Chloroflexi bacterium]|nr:DUF2182 domain-containing protein [Chloroflexota bacterium]